jgi:hypothetical protein
LTPNHDGYDGSMQDPGQTWRSERVMGSAAGERR